MKCLFLKAFALQRNVIESINRKSFLVQIETKYSNFFHARRYKMAILWFDSKRYENNTQIVETKRRKKIFLYGEIKFQFTDNSRVILV